MKEFSLTESNIGFILRSQRTFTYEGQKYITKIVDKPRTISGEPKTDIYFLAESLDDEKRQLIRKISYKQPNHDFIENKVNARRAEEILGKNWSTILSKCQQELAPAFMERKLIFLDSYRRTDKGSFTLGWKIEFVNKKNGELSIKMPFSHNQVRSIYSGDNLIAEKRNAIASGRTIQDSGVADYILVGRDYASTEDILASLVDIDSYVASHPDIYLACKALNYRSLEGEGKYDGDRPLGVHVEWRIKGGKLTGRPILDRPLEQSGNTVYAQLSHHLTTLNIKTTDDVNPNNTDFSIVFKP